MCCAAAVQRSTSVGGAGEGTVGYILYRDVLRTYRSAVFGTSAMYTDVERRHPDDSYLSGLFSPEPLAQACYAIFYAFLLHCFISVFVFTGPPLKQEKALKLQTRPNDPLCRPLVAQRNASECSTFIFKVTDVLASLLHGLMLLVVMLVLLLPPLLMAVTVLLLLCVLFFVAGYVVDIRVAVLVLLLMLALLLYVLLVLLMLSLFSGPQLTHRHKLPRSRHPPPPSHPSPYLPSIPFPLPAYPLPRHPPPFFSSLITPPCPVRPSAFRLPFPPAPFSPFSALPLSRSSCSPASRLLLSAVPG